MSAASSSVLKGFWSSWESSGRANFIKHCKTAVLHSPVDCMPVLQAAIYGLANQVVNGCIKPESAAATTKEMLLLRKDVASLLADTLSVIDVETTVEENRNARERFIIFLSALLPNLPDWLVKERLDLETLEIVGLVKNIQQFQQKYVKIKTKLYYKQQKFNLLREENEGYAKLVTELCQEPNVGKVKSIESLIGYFNLDPNRVLDIIIEAFECHPKNADFFVSLLHHHKHSKDTLCQVLGFKFKFYQKSEENEGELTDDSAVGTPASLYRVAALLLQHDLVDLDSLYLHLTPDDATIVDNFKKEIADAKQYARKLNTVSLNKESTGEEKKEGGGDDGHDKTDDLPIVTATAAKDPGLVGAPLPPGESADSRSADQKLGLIQALLEVGAWEPARVMLNRMPPKHATAYSPLADALCSLIHSAIEPLYSQHSGLGSVLKSSSYALLPSGNPCPAALLVRTWPAYARIVLPMTHYLGHNLSRDPVLMVKLMRLSRFYITNFMQRIDISSGRQCDIDVVLAAILSNIDEVMFPSLSLLPCNCCVSDEMWQLLKNLPYTLRYRLYGQWKNDSYNTHARLIKAKADCLERGKYIMKRLTKESVKPSGRHLGKLSHSNPGIIFEYVLSQIQKYDNFILPVVDSLKYLTQLSYDVLAFCIIEALANPDRERQKAEETNISPWLASLASFCGNIFRKYNIDLAGLLQYVSNQLKAGKSFDLLVLREVVQKMSGIEITEELTNDQLEAMAGGEMLRQEGGYFAQVRNTKKPSSRLKEALLEHKLALPLVLLMAQHRDCAVYQEALERHVKLTGKLFDTCQDTLVQFGSFLATQLSADEWLKRLPSIDVLVSQFHLQPDAAFFLSRPMYQTNIGAKFAEGVKKIEKEQKEKEKKVAKEAKEAKEAGKDGEDLQLVKASPSSKSALNKLKTEKHIETVNAVIEPIVAQVKPLFQEKVWNDLSTQFYVTFWTLSMYDLKSPTDSYEKEKQKLKNQLRIIDDNSDLAPNKKKKEKERCNALMEKLSDEEKKQEEHVSRTTSFLLSQKESWFGVSKSTKNDTITQFLQLCIFPRCVFTPNDAVYCALFIKAVHDLKTTNFSTLICFDRLFCDVTLPLAQCTENEASRYGRFLNAMLETVKHWHADKEVYDKECVNFPGFKTVFRSGGSSAKGGSDASSKEDHLDFENFRHVCHKWHFKITKSIITCLESGDYLLIRNSLIILTKIASFFPRIQNLGQALERRVEKLQKDEKERRPDLYVLAIGYGGMLKMNKKSWIPEHDFHTVSKEKKANASSSSTSTNSMLGVIGARREAAPAKTEKAVKADATPTEKPSEPKRPAAPPPPLLMKKENGAVSRKEEKEGKPGRESKEPKTREVKVLGRVKDLPKTNNNGLKVEDHHLDETANSPLQISKTSRSSQSPMDHRRVGRGSSEDHRFDASADSKIAHHDVKEDRHRSSRSVEAVEHPVGRDSAPALSNSDEDESPQNRANSRRSVEQDEDVVNSGGHKDHKRRKVESKGSHESPKSHKKDKLVGGADGSRSSKAAKRGRRSPSLDYETEIKRSRKEMGATNGSDVSSSSTHKERKLEEKKIRERERNALLSSRESSPSIVLSKERKEERKMQREHDRLLAISAGNPVEDRRKVEPLLADVHKKSKHDKHRSK